MALSLLTIHRINTGRIAPFEISISELIALQGRRHANYFRDTAKNIVDNELAESYKQKMFLLSLDIIQNRNPRFAVNMLLNFTNIIGNVEDEQDVMTKDIAAWEALVEQHINELFELEVGVTAEEKDAYQNYIEE